MGAAVLVSAAPLRAEPTEPAGAAARQLAETDARRQQMDAARAAEPALEKLDQALQELVVGVRAANLVDGLVGTGAPVRYDNLGRVFLFVVTNHPDELTSANSAALAAVGFETNLVSPPMSLFQGYAPVSALTPIARLPFVARVQSPTPPVSQTGSVNSQGDAIHRADLARVAGVTGLGRRVGVISDGATARATAQVTGDLPLTVFIMPGIGGSGHEGTAMMEIVFDLAPGALLGFAGPASTAEMVAAYDNFSTTGLGVGGPVDVISDDLIFFAEPMFEDGPIAQAATRAVSRGTLVFSAAGNQATQHYEGAYTDANSDGFHEFGGGSNTLRVGINAGRTVRCVLQWNDRFGASSSNYDLFAVSATSGAIISQSTAVQDGNDDPFEIVSLVNNGASAAVFDVKIRLVAGAARQLKMYCFGSSSMQFGTSVGSVSFHQASNDVIAVAAINASNPGNTTIASYSSRGPSRRDFPTLEFRSKPDITAIDGVAITGSGGFSNPFFGTSAASPHAAAIAALVKQRYPTETPQQIRNRLNGYASDRGTPGFDTTFGFGLLNAEASSAPFTYTRRLMLPASSR